MSSARSFLGAASEDLSADGAPLAPLYDLRSSFDEIIGVSDAMAAVFRLMESAATTAIAVLLEGETGTGKELVARAIHRISERSQRPFVAVNCAALPETLLESELFGYRKGAFTGAASDRIGLFEAADAGTIFLDEIGEMPLAMQAKMLRVLQDGEVVPLGDTRPRHVDARLISATNSELSTAMAAGRFREDLYYRLAAFPIRLPPLRERRQDIALLTSRFLAAAATRHHKQIAGLEKPALELLLRADWPGNVRELQNLIERAVALARDGEVLTIEHLAPQAPPAGEFSPYDLRPDTDGIAHFGRERCSVSAAGADPDLRRARAAFETEHIREILARHGGNISRAARALGVSRVVLRKKAKEYDLR
ncbi:MAG: sigma 54-interacting transcriptional regulator [Deltaproteobacteria bacterium]|nr:sigma 54-interacting transcriptional regulator [Deltaproteobacteria bacterium]